MLVGMVITPALKPRALGQKIHPVRTAPQGKFPQGSQGLNGKEVGARALRRIIPVDISTGQTLQQLCRFNIHQFYLIRLIEHGIRDALAHRNAGNGGDGIIQALNMLDIDRRVHIDSGIQQLLHILIPLGVPAAFGIGMGQLVHQNELRLAFQRAVNIKLPETPSSVRRLRHRKLLQTVEQRRCLWPGMGFDIPGNHIHTALFRLMRRLQHGVGLSHTGGVAEKDLQPAPFFI